MNQIVDPGSVCNEYNEKEEYGSAYDCGNFIFAACKFL